MKPLDPWAARYGSISDSTLATIATFSPASVKIIQALPYFIDVWRAANLLCKALAVGELAYEKQGELEKLLAEVPK